MFDRPWDWGEADLIRLTDEGIEESLTLEYKESRWLGKHPDQKSKICKAVCAMANSAGGTIVVGVPENKHKPQQLDGGVNTEEYTREWLESVIYSGIQRRVEVFIKPVELSHSPTRSAFVIHIPQSRNAPHQVRDDKVFYKRFNFMAVPMEEYEVRDAANRAAIPDAEIVLGFRSKKDEFLQRQSLNLGKIASDPIEIWPVLRNNGNVPVDYASITLFLSDDLVSTGKFAPYSLMIDKPPPAAWMEVPKEEGFIELPAIRFPFQTCLPIRRDWHVGRGDLPAFGNSDTRLTQHPIVFRVNTFYPRSQPRVAIGWEIMTHGLQRTVWGYLVCDPYDVWFEWLPDSHLPTAR